MFKKPFKVSGAHFLSNKDKKKLREKLEKKQKYSKQLVDYILDDSNFDDEELEVCKIAQSKCAFLGLLVMAEGCVQRAVSQNPTGCEDILGRITRHC